VRFGATDPRALLLRTHTQTAGVSLTAQQPLNNIARVAIQALAAVLGGAQSLHTNSYDETWALPTEEAVTVALRTQQIIAEESGVASTVDPLGGAYFVEALTDRIEAEAWQLIRRIDELGGMIRALEAGFPQQEIADAGYHTQLQEDAGERVVVGVNKYAQEDEKSIAYLRLDDSVEREQAERTRAAKVTRNAAEAERLRQRVADACRTGANLMPVLIEAVQAQVSLGEIADVYREVFGRYREPIIF
jgi:methylmalonyl-CoA mutase N-terminal domain/subunit